MTDQHSTDPSKHKGDSPEEMQCWADHVKGKINCFTGTINQFFDVFLPCSEPCPRADKKQNIQGAFSGLKKPAGFIEPEMYGTMINGLNVLVKDFPSDKCLVFDNTHSTSLGFPYAKWIPDHGNTIPGISMLRPGVKSSMGKTWQDICLVFDVWDTWRADPMRKSNGERPEAQVNLARNARNLLVAHGAVFCFVVGIYGPNMRIFHFDRAGAAASPSFSYVSRPDVLRHFLWRFVHPATRHSFAGLDGTSSVPSQKELNLAWRKRKVRNADRAKPKCSQSRWVTVPSGDGKTEKFLTTRILCLSSRLFSRATLVREALSADSQAVVVKDAWRPSSCQRETAFYLALETHFEQSKTEPYGLPRMICGTDLGGLAPQLDAAPQTPRWPSLLYHRTISAFFSNFKHTEDLERNHMRLVTDLVGRPLDGFLSSFEAITALRDAIIGHKKAYDIGILHRDISAGNVMIVDGKPFKGFIHDFDCSSFWQEALAQLRESGELAELTRKNLEEDDIRAATCQDKAASNRPEEKNELTEIRGTLEYMAIDLLDTKTVVHLVQHDLESFYWLLIWLVLRHTRHNHEAGSDACQNLFSAETECICRSLKQEWLHTAATLTVSDNAPLTDLLCRLKVLVRKSQRDRDPEPLTHDTMLHAFNRALEEKGWPKGDKALPFPPVDHSPASVERPRPQLGSDILGTSASTKPVAVRKRRAAHEPAAPPKKRRRS